MKNILLKLLQLFVVIGLFSCGGKSKGEIKVLAWDDPHTKKIQELIPEFEKKTGIRVNLELAPSGGLMAKTAVSISKDKSDYDVITVDGVNIPALASLMEPYEKWPNGSKYQKLTLKEYATLVADSAKWNNSVMGLPINGNIYIWVARKDLIEDPNIQKEFKAKYGYDLAFPDTLQNILDAGEFFKAKGIAGFGPFTKGGTAGISAEAIFMFESFGTTFLSKVDGKYKVTLDKAKAKDAIEFYKKLVAVGPAGAMAMGHGERGAAFQTGKVFTMFMWPALVPGVENADTSLVKGKVSYGVPPKGPAKRAAVLGCWALMIPAASKNKKAAAEFAYWWASKEVGLKLIEAGVIPARVDILEDQSLADKYPYFKAVSESMKYAVLRPTFEKTPEVFDIITRNWSAAIAGTMKTEEAIDKMISETEDVIAKAGL